MTSRNDVETQSAYKGVYRTSWGNAWWSMIKHKGERIYLGTFTSPEAAHTAYTEAKQKLK